MYISIIIIIIIIIIYIYILFQLHFMKIIHSLFVTVIALN